MQCRGSGSVGADRARDRHHRGGRLLGEPLGTARRHRPPYRRLQILRTLHHSRRLNVQGGNPEGRGCAGEVRVALLSEFSKGPNGLIKKGAKVILNSDDILEVYNLSSHKINKGKKRKIRNNNQTDLLLESEAEIIIYKLIKKATERSEKITADEIIKNTKLDTSTINSTLSILEIRNLLKNDFGNYDLK